MSFLSRTQEFFAKGQPKKSNKKEPYDNSITGISPGRVSQPDDGTFFSNLKFLTNTVTPTFDREVIPFLRKLYKVNPDIMVVIQDMFKLANTGHIISFPFNTSDESSIMREHLAHVSRDWSNYTSGINGIVNKMMVQALIGGAISTEAVPNNNLTGIKTIVFIKPETIVFARESDGTYTPYQNSFSILNMNNNINGMVKLNLATYKYTGIFNDIDEPYGIPPFITALGPIKNQNDMKDNINNIMSLMGLIGFLEAKMEKPSKIPSESDRTYMLRLTNLLKELKVNLAEGMKDGIVTGFMGDHEFNLNSTTANLDNVDSLWNMNQQSIANGLATSGSIIGVNSDDTESGSGITLSKIISELGNLQLIVSSQLEFIYRLELILAGFNVKTVKVDFLPSTVSDNLKIQQALEIKIRNNESLYDQGIISQNEFAFSMGYATPDKAKPRVPRTSGATNTNSSSVTSVPSTSPVNVSKKKQIRKQQKSSSAKTSRATKKVVPKRNDQKN